MNPKSLKVFAVSASLVIVYLLIRDHRSQPSANYASADQRGAPVNSPASLADQAARLRAEQETLARRAILARIESLESDYRLKSQQLIEKKNEQAEYNGRVQDYFMQHKAACVALGFGLAGAEVFVEQNKNTSDGAKLAAGLAAGLGAIWAYNNPREAKEVGNALLQVQANQADYKRQVASLQQQVNSTMTQLANERARLQ